MKRRKFALITGASSGIGKSVAFELASRGYGLLLVALEDPDLRLTTDEISGKYKVPAHSLGIDLRREDAEKDICSWFSQLDCDLEILVNNVGIGYVNAYLDRPLSYWDTVLKLNSIVMMRLTYSLLPHLLKRERGYIMNVSSATSLLPVPYKVIYSASKYFVSSFSFALREELKDYSNVSVTCIIPGNVMTNNKIKERTDSFGIIARLSLMMPEAVAKESVKAMFNRKRKHTPGKINYLLVCLSRLLGYRTTMAIISKGVRKNLQFQEQVSATMEEKPNIKVPQPDS